LPTCLDEAAPSLASLFVLIFDFETVLKGDRQQQKLRKEVPEAFGKVTAQD
jgi:hypothetical protein